jgi:DNA repair protein RadC
MNLSMLDREQLEAILLDPPVPCDQPLRCSDSLVLPHRSTGDQERQARIRHVLAAAHELLVRVASESIVGRRVAAPSHVLKEYLTHYIAGCERELFVVVFLDGMSRVIAAEEMFAGTLAQTSVFAREIVKRALQHNASAVVFAHNHPSGIPEPSFADVTVTITLKSALDLIDVRVTDHVVVGGSDIVSLADRGLI